MSQREYMQIEIQGFFLRKIEGENYKKFNGSMKIFLPEKNMQILGITVKKHNENWFFTMPGMKTFHHETGKRIGIPFVSFANKEEKQCFFSKLKENAISYIIEQIRTNNLKLPVKPNDKKYMAKGKNKPRFAKKVQNGVHKKRPFNTKTNKPNYSSVRRNTGRKPEGVGEK